MDKHTKNWKLEIQDGAFYRTNRDAIYHKSSFDLDNTRLSLLLNISRNGAIPNYINACDAKFSSYYNKGSINAFLNPQWQFGVKILSQSHFTWYDLPTLSVNTADDPCEFHFSRALITKINTMYPHINKNEFRVRMRFGLVLTPIEQDPSLQYCNIYSPEFNLTPEPTGGYEFQAPATIDLLKTTDEYSVTPTNHFFYTQALPRRIYLGDSI